MADRPGREGTPEAEISAWFAEKIPEPWFVDLDVKADADEILVVGTLPGSDPPPDGETVTSFRESTRSERVRLAERAETLFRRKVSWGVRAREDTWLFTHLTVPVMTRLRLPERRVLDTLVEGGVARSRSDALAWCVRLVRNHEAAWLEELQESLVKVREVRSQAPGA